MAKRNRKSHYASSGGSAGNFGGRSAAAPDYEDVVVDLCVDTTNAAADSSSSSSAKRARTDQERSTSSSYVALSSEKPSAASSEPVNLCDSSDDDDDTHDVFQNRSARSMSVKHETPYADTKPVATATAASAASTSQSSRGGNNGVAGGQGLGLVMLNSLQRKAVEAAERGDNVFITGPAGTGKSVVLKHIMNHLKDKFKDEPESYVAVAPTGPTAISIGGQTIHSFAGCGVPETAKDFEKCWEKKHRKKWRDLRVMVIEEISMISGEFFDRLSGAVCNIRGKPSGMAFGGIQLILCGDFLQLPPIPKQAYKIKAAKEALARQGKSAADLHLDRGFAFQAKAWRNADLEVIQLDQVFRQNCGNFISVLREIRLGRVSPEALAFLQRCNRPLPPNKDGIKPTVLYATNKDVTAENMMHLNKLPGELEKFHASDFAEPEDDAPGWVESALLRNGFYKQCLAEDTLYLKEGAQVMLIKNEIQEDGADPKRRLVNGSRGKVVGFTNNGEDSDSDVEDDDAADDGRSYPIVMFQGGRRKVIRPERFESRIVGMGTCVRKAIPLKLAWAVTMHKSQGLTLDYVKADVKGVFTEAQAYVALSRATDENGLELRHFSERVVRADKRALAFYADPKGNAINRWDELEEAAAASTPSSTNENACPVQVPSGKKGNSLAGLAFVITGDFEGYSRDSAEQLIKDCGGVVRSAVSGKTNYLVIGESIDGNRSVTTGNKYKKAQQIIGGENKAGLKIIRKDGLFSLINARK